MRFFFIAVALLILLVVGFGLLSMPMRVVPQSGSDSTPVTGPGGPTIMAKSADSLEERLQAHVRMLADEIGPRYPAEGGRENLEKAARYIESHWTALGYSVESQPVALPEAESRNLWVTLPGSDPTAPRIVVGAHYDSAQQNRTPGADDNASGTALLLELSSALKGYQGVRTILLVAFTTEEPPYFQRATMGSWLFAKKLAEEQVPVELMLSLECLGYFTDAPESQRFPDFGPIPELPGLPKKLLEDPPTVGNFVAIVGRVRSAERVYAFGKLFDECVDLPVQIAPLPAFLERVSWSDHWSFWQHGFEGVMLTDTAALRNPTYHRETDTWDTLDYARMAKLSDGLVPLVKKLAK